MGGSKLLRSSGRDDVTLIGAGVTLHACLERQTSSPTTESVHESSTATRSSRSTTRLWPRLLAATSGRVVVAEDHHPEGGLGSAVIASLLANGQSKLQFVHLAVRGMPGSGTGEELMAWAGIDADHIAVAAGELMRGK